MHTSPAWVPLNEAAARLGMTRDTLAASCRNGSVPLTIRRQGLRKLYVNAAQLDAYIGSNG